MVISFIPEKKPKLISTFSVLKLIKLPNYQLTLKKIATVEKIYAH